MPETLELEPEQPDEVARAVEMLLATTADDQPDPWWQAGLTESLTADA
jgi:hypothetical protein